MLLLMVLLMKEALIVVVPSFDKDTISFEESF
jgi:hypothetical protein